MGYRGVVMEKVFITKSNLASIAYHLDGGRVTKDELRKFFDSRFLTSFSHRELKTLSAVKLVLDSIKDEELAVTLVEEYKENHQRPLHHCPRNSRLVYNAPSQPAFHRDELCPTLLNDYKNFLIPVAIKREQHDAFRAFFDAHRDLYETRRDVFFARAELAFNIKIQGIDEIHNPNSGSKGFDITHKKPGEILADMDDLAAEMDDYKNGTSHIRKIIDAAGFNPRQASEIPQYAGDQEILAQWGRYKSSMKDLIIEHLTSVFAPERRFSRAFLDQLGFRECGCCHGNRGDRHEPCRKALDAA